jgi:hypothetical protein
MLFDLAGAAGLEQKRAAMASGQHINTTGTIRIDIKKDLLYIYIYENTCYVCIKICYIFAFKFLFILVYIYKYRGSSCYACGAKGTQGESPHG